MTMLFIEGFEWLDGSTDREDIEVELQKNGWVLADLGTGAGGLVTTRGTHQGLSLGNGHDITTLKLRETAQSDTIVLGFYYKTAAAFSTGNIFAISSAGTRQCGVETNVDGTLDFERGSTTLLETSVFALATSNEYYLEFKIKIDDSTGYLEMKVADLTAGGDDIETTLEWATATNLDTQFTSNAYDDGWDTVAFFGASNARIIDDIYILDTNGSTNNDYIGNVIVPTIHPDGAGNSTQMTPLSGSNYQNVDETAPSDDDTTYNTADADGEMDLFTMDDLSDSGDVAAVQVHAQCKVTEGDPRKVRLVVRSGSTNEESDDQTMANDEYGTMFDIFEQNPDTASDWTNSDVDDIECGVKRQS